VDGRLAPITSWSHCFLLKRLSEKRENRNHVNHFARVCFFIVNIFAPFKAQTNFFIYGVTDCRVPKVWMVPLSQERILLRRHAALKRTRIPQTSFVFVFHLFAFFICVFFGGVESKLKAMISDAVLLACGNAAFYVCPLTV
jgi:hypothetical protein